MNMGFDAILLLASLSHSEGGLQLANNLLLMFHVACHGSFDAEILMSKVSPKCHILNLPSDPLHTHLSVRVFSPILPISAWATSLADNEVQYSAWDKDCLLYLLPIQKFGHTLLLMRNALSIPL